MCLVWISWDKGVDWYNTFDFVWAATPSRPFQQTYCSPSQTTKTDRFPADLMPQSACRGSKANKPLSLNSLVPQSCPSFSEPQLKQHLRVRLERVPLPIELMHQIQAEERLQPLQAPLTLLLMMGAAVVCIDNAHLRAHQGQPLLPRPLAPRHAFGVGQVEPGVRPQRLDVLLPLHAHALEDEAEIVVLDDDVGGHETGPHLALRGGRVRVARRQQRQIGVEVFAEPAHQLLCILGQHVHGVDDALGEGGRQAFAIGRLVVWAGDEAGDDVVVEGV
ncbi:hypothetical protein IWZ00DRAFT_563549 [Phyllosticta capitalensis]